MKSMLTTLCYIEKEDSYLMLHRISKKNDVNKEKWIGVGGHFEKDESPEDCLLREVKEETGLALTSYHFRGIVTFILKDKGSELTEYMCLYTADDYVQRSARVRKPDTSSTKYRPRNHSSTSLGHHLLSTLLTDHFDHHVFH